MEWKTISEILQAFEASKISERQAATLIARYTDSITLNQKIDIHTFILMLDRFGIRYRRAVIRGNIYITLIAGEGSVNGDSECFTQFCFDSKGMFLDLSLFTHDDK